MKWARLWSLIMMLGASSMANAQSYAFDTTGITFRKSIDFGTVHGYLAINNLTADTLNMRWECMTDSTFPSAWQVNFDDQNQYYPSVSNDSTGEFKLYPSGSFSQKLIIGLAHHQVIDTQEVRFKVFPIDSAGDTTWITYRFEIFRSAPDTGTTDSSSTGIQDVVQKPAFRMETYGSITTLTCLQSISELLIHDLHGRIVKRWNALKPGQRRSFQSKWPVILTARTQQGMYRQTWVPSLH